MLWKSTFGGATGSTLGRPVDVNIYRPSAVWDFTTLRIVVYCYHAVYPLNFECTVSICIDSYVSSKVNCYTSVFRNTKTIKVNNYDLIEHRLIGWQTRHGHAASRRFSFFCGQSQTTRRALIIIGVTEHRWKWRFPRKRVRINVKSFFYDLPKKNTNFNRCVSDEVNANSISPETFDIYSYTLRRFLHFNTIRYVHERRTSWVAS